MEALTSFFANIDWFEIWLATCDTLPVSYTHLTLPTICSV